MAKQDNKTCKIVASPPVYVKVLRGKASEKEEKFFDSFTIGYADSCDFQINDDRVSRKHVKISLENYEWKIKDLRSTNGTFVEGSLLTNEIVLTKEMHIELGRGGPMLLISIIPPVPEANISNGDKERNFESVTQIVQYHFDKKDDEEAGESTQMFRLAFDRVHTQRSKKYKAIIVMSILFLLASAGVITFQKMRLNKLKATAEDMFYTMKSIELQINQIEEVIPEGLGKKQKKILNLKRTKLKELSKQYEKFVTELGLYEDMDARKRTIHQVARAFGECDINVPNAFVKEVTNYINRWKTSQRLRDSLSRAKKEKYGQLITETLSKYNLPPHFFFLPMQESDFKIDAVGPRTRYGIAKGIWQFIPLTARDYGLKIGPRYKKRQYDPRDDRHNFAKSTEAGVKYLKDLNNTEAQASGLLVMASYNWGQGNTRKLIRKMPKNPWERNFWRLIKYEKIPKETYDYVFYIFSAAVICENPDLFEFNLDCPDLSLKG